MKRRQAAYHAIALDLAKRIASGEVEVGARISGRSILSCQYSVSPETIRKAISLLRDSNVVQVSQGKEIVVTSKENARHFIERSNSAGSGLSLRDELEALLAQKLELDKQLEAMVRKILHYPDKIKNLYPIVSEEIKVPGNSHVAGKTLKEVDFRRHTGATVIAIRRGDAVIAPGPDTEIQPDDILVIVGPAGISAKAAYYLGRSQAKSPVLALGRLGALFALALVSLESLCGALEIVFYPVCQTGLALLVECV